MVAQRDLNRGCADERNEGEPGTGYAHMLSACLSEEGISLGQLNVDKKTNEIMVFPK